MKNKALFVIYILVVCACEAPDPAAPVSGESAGLTVTVQATAETEPTLQDGANDPAIWFNAVNPAASLVLGGTSGGGLELYALDGSRVGAVSGPPVALLDVRYNIPLGGALADLVVGVDVQSSGLVVYRVDAAKRTLQQVSNGSIPTNAEVEGLCLYQSPLSGKLYAFVAAAGTLQQWEFFDRGGEIAATKVRSLPVGAGAGHCAVHDQSSTLFFSEETVGVWRMNPEPESETGKELVDVAEPFGRFVGDVKGLAIYEMVDGDGYLVVSDADASRLQFYGLQSLAHAGSMTISAGDSIDAVEETEGLSALGMSLGENYPTGMLVVADDVNPDGHTNFKIVAWDDVTSALGLNSGAPQDPARIVKLQAITVSPSVETEPVLSFGDAADDPAIWVHPTDPELSLVIGAQKKRGINVYDLSGNLLQSLPDGRINNVDVRYGFSLDGESVDIITGSNRSSDSISIYKVDTETRRIVNVADGVIDTGMSDPYGQCMYRSAAGEYYVYINDTSGLVRQWVLQDSGSGLVSASLVREFNVGSQTEGCVADDETGALYIGEENFGIWKYSADTDGGEERTLIDRVDDEGNLTADVEGLAIYYGPGGTGYLIASNQGADSYAVYSRDDNNRFVGLFHVVADEQTGIDGSSETDGLDVTSASLGSAFPNGVFIAQDGRNITPDERQNFKLVPWERIASAMGLEIYSGYDPRAASN